MFEERFVPRRTPESRAIVKRVQEAMLLTSRVNSLPFENTDARGVLLEEILGRPLPETVTIYPPFYCDYGLNIDFGERAFVNQGCWFLDIGGITIGDRTMIGPNVTISTAGHPVALAERYDGITMRPASQLDRVRWRTGTEAGRAGSPDRGEAFKRVHVGPHDLSCSGVERVWDYPRPPALVPCDRRVLIEAAGMVIAESTNALRVLETSHPPTIYLPPADVRSDLLAASTARQTFCEFKGVAHYLDLVVNETQIAEVAWTYPQPAAGYEALRDHVSFYPGRVDAAWLDEERVNAQPGDFYGGWITADLVGPFKGSPGTLGW